MISLLLTGQAALIHSDDDLRIVIKVGESVYFDENSEVIGTTNKGLFHDSEEADSSDK
ncbi:MAG: hypothetical protein ACI854_002019 [Arenicella sp.]|jgi:hypothetical protein